MQPVSTRSREILGRMLGDSESEGSGSEFFSGLKSLGLRGVVVVVSNRHSGLLKDCKPSRTWQRCQTHLMRNFLDATPKGLQDELEEIVTMILGTVQFSQVN